MTTEETKPSVSALDAESLPRHRWYFFKEAFSPAVVNHAIQDAKLDSSAIVFDPFSGSGTTCLAAGLAGMRGIGTEVNPFLHFVAKTKALNVSLDEFDNAIKLASDGASKGKESPLLKFSTFSEQAQTAIRRKKWLFDSKILNSFEGAKQNILSVSAPVKSLIDLCLIGAAMDNSNAVKDGKCLRYKKNWESFNLNKDNFIESFNQRTAIVREDLEKTSKININASITQGDSRQIDALENFDLCVTSPPYLNSFDYTDVYRPELFLSGYVSTLDDLRTLRFSTLRSHVQVAWENPTRNDFGHCYIEAMKELKEAETSLAQQEKKLWNKKLPNMIQAYFEDMEQVLFRLRQKAQPHASTWLVVSTSAYAGVEIPVDLILADIASKCGWFLRKITVLRHLKRVAGQQWDKLSERENHEGPHLRESLVILDASNQKFKTIK